PGAGHHGDRGSVDVRVEQPDRRPALTQRRRQVDRNRRFADPAFARRDSDRLLDAGKYLWRFRAHERGPDVGGHADLDARHAGDLAGGVFCLRLEAVAYRAGRRRELKREADSALRADVQLIDHAEADHIAAQVGMLDAPERVEDLLRGRCAHPLRSYRGPAIEGGPPDKFNAPMKQETAISPASELIAYYGGPASDVYFQRAQKTLAGAHVDAVVAMDFFAGRPGIVCGVAEATRLLGGILQPGDEAWAIAEGEAMGQKETVLRIRAPYSRFG